MKNRLYLSLVVIVLLCLVGWTGYGQGQRSNPARQAWEYKSLVYAIRGAANAVLYEEGKPPSGSATPVTRAPELGDQGWELVSVAASESASTTTYVYWFKRPK